MSCRAPRGRVHFTAATVHDREDHRHPICVPATRCLCARESLSVGVLAINKIASLARHGPRHGFVSLRGVYTTVQVND
jgi:hypothetical protein